MDRESLLTAARAALGVIRELREANPDEEFPAVMLYFGANKELIHSQVLPFKDNHQKLKMVWMHKEYVRLPIAGIAACALVSDAYYVTSKTSELPKGNLEDHPDRREALIVFGYSPRAIVRLTLPYHREAGRIVWEGDTAGKKGMSHQSDAVEEESMVSCWDVWAEERKQSADARTENAAV